MVPEIHDYGQCRPGEQEWRQGEVFGHDIDTIFGAKLNLGVVPQEFNFNQFEKVIDIVTTQAGYYGIPQAGGFCEKYLRKLGLWDKRDAPSRMLSGGMKRRLMIAGLVHELRLLILTSRPPVSTSNYGALCGSWKR